MSLVRFTPRRLADPFAQLERVVDSVVPAFAAGTRRVAWAPRVDVLETADALEVSAELPGLTEQDIELHVRENVLTIKGEKRSGRADAEAADTEDDEGATEAEAPKVYYSERHYGKFQRSLALPSHVNSDEANATFADGILTVRLPKADSHRSRQISIASD
jgi:HSP20 family protein